MNKFALLKKQLRKEIRHRLAEYSSEQIARESAVIARKLTDYLKTSDSPYSKIALFAPLPYEPDLTVLHELLPESRFYYPLCQADNRLSFHLIKNPSTDLSPGTMNIMEPSPESESIAGEELDVVIVPGLGFSPNGARLGKGGGYYDRFFSDDKIKARRLGVAFTCQKENHLPMEAHDFHVDHTIFP